jgi:hypothetical protein
MSTERTSRYHVRRREFLNENPEAAAFIIAIVEDTRDIPDENEDGWKWADIQLDLADCVRRVSFDFNLNDPVERANSLRKINLLADVINQVRDAIALECESRAARPHIQQQEAAVA